MAPCTQALVVSGTAICFSWNGKEQMLYIGSVGKRGKQSRKEKKWLKTMVEDFDALNVIYTSGFLWGLICEWHSFPNVQEHQDTIFQKFLE